MKRPINVLLTCPFVIPDSSTLTEPDALPDADPLALLSALIDRELTYLRRMLRLAHQDGLLAAAPYVAAQWR